MSGLSLLGRVLNGTITAQGIREHVSDVFDDGETVGLAGDLAGLAQKSGVTLATMSEAEAWLLKAAATPVIAGGLQILLIYTFLAGWPVEPDVGGKFAAGSAKFGAVGDEIGAAQPPGAWSGSGSDAYLGRCEEQHARAQRVQDADERLRTILAAEADAVNETRDLLDRASAALGIAIVPAVLLLATGPEGILLSEAFQIAAVATALGIATPAMDALEAKSQANAGQIQQIAAEYSQVAATVKPLGAVAAPGTMRSVVKKATPGQAPSAPAAPAPAPAAPAANVPGRNVPAAPADRGAAAGAGTPAGGGTDPAGGGVPGAGGTAPGAARNPAPGAGTPGEPGAESPGEGAAPGGADAKSPDAPVKSPDAPVKSPDASAGAPDAAATPASAGSGIPGGGMPSLPGGGAGPGGAGSGLLGGLAGPAAQALGQLGQGGTQPAAASGAPGGQGAAPVRTVSDTRPADSGAEEVAAGDATPPGAAAGGQSSRAPIHLEVEVDPDQLSGPVHLTLDPKNP